VLEVQGGEARIGEHRDPLLADPQLESPARLSPGRHGQSENADGAQRFDERERHQATIPAQPTVRERLGQPAT
jgi:hypothetical protein